MTPEEKTAEEAALTNKFSGFKTMQGMDYELRWTKFGLCALELNMWHGLARHDCYHPDCKGTDRTVTFCYAHSHDHHTDELQDV